MLALLELLREAVGEGFHVRSGQPIACRHSEPEPDVSVVRGRKEDYIATLPQTAELVVEVAVSSADVDRRKIAIYAEAGVREYWIVLPGMRQIEVRTKLIESRYTAQHVFTEGQTASSEVLPDLRVELTGLFRP